MCNMKKEKVMKELIKEGLSIDERINRINVATENVKKGFLIIALEMDNIKKGWEGNVNSYLKYIEEKTGYKKRAVYYFLNAKIALENLEQKCTAVHKLPDSEGVIRPLATAKLNANPEKQAALWERAQEIAGGEPTEKDVKAAIREDRLEELADLPVFERKQTHIRTALNPEELACFKTIMKKAMIKNHPDHGGDGGPEFITMYKKIMGMI